MKIDIQILKEVMDYRVKEIKSQFYGTINPKINKYEAIERLGEISAIVLTLHEKVEEPLKEPVWELKHESDTLIEKLFSM
ncbi:hypothetical protein [Sporosarcina sp. FSL K6-1508]|uniref:hypothetical protein n=1 Tax=Sporosarcina sp. FSL K6-1508 TaxID=2921553 RepID=UPI0030FAA2AD